MFKMTKHDVIMFLQDVQNVQQIRRVKNEKEIGITNVSRRNARYDCFGVWQE